MYFIFLSDVVPPNVTGPEENFPLCPVNEHASDGRLFKVQLNKWTKKSIHLHSNIT